MYSYEDRLRAVKLYQKLERRMNATLRQLEYSNQKFAKGRGVLNSQTMTRPEFG